MHVTWHAQCRFARRVDATADPILSVMAMWYGGKKASRVDLQISGIRAVPGFSYRVCRHQDRCMILVAANDSIVTILY